MSSVAAAARHDVAGGGISRMRRPFRRRSPLACLLGLLLGLPTSFVAAFLPPAPRTPATRRSSSATRGGAGEGAASAIVSRARPFPRRRRFRIEAGAAGGGPIEVAAGERCAPPSGSRRRRRRCGSFRGRLRSSLVAASAFLAVWWSDLGLDLGPGGIVSTGAGRGVVPPAHAAAVAVGGRAEKASARPSSSRASGGEKGGADAQRGWRERSEKGAVSENGGRDGDQMVSKSYAARARAALDGLRSRNEAAKAAASDLDRPSAAAGAVAGLSVGVALGRGSVLLFRSSNEKDGEEDESGEDGPNGLIKTSAPPPLTTPERRSDDEKYWERRVASLVAAAEEAEKQAREARGGIDATGNDSNGDRGSGGGGGSAGGGSGRWTAKRWTALSTKAPGEERVEAILASYTAAELREGKARQGAEQKRLVEEARAAEDAKAADRARVQALIGATAEALSPDSPPPSRSREEGGEEDDEGPDATDDKVRRARREAADLRRQFEAERTRSAALEAELAERGEAEQALREELDAWRRMKGGRGE